MVISDSIYIIYAPLLAISSGRIFRSIYVTESNTDMCLILSNTPANKVIYPTLGCDIQGFQAMRFNFQYIPRWFKDFPAIWLAVPRELIEPVWEYVSCQEKNLSLCEISCFRGWIKFSRRITRTVKSLFWQLGPIQELTNRWGKNNNFLNNGTYWNIVEIPQTVRHWLTK